MARQTPEGFTFSGFTPRRAAGGLVAAGLVVASLGATGLAGATFAASSAFAHGAGADATTDASADKGTLTRLEAAQYAEHASALFTQADINQDGLIDAREYRALAIVTAELSRLSRSVTLLVGGEARGVAISYDGPASLSRAERARIDAVSARAFFLAAGADNAISADEFVAFEMERFASADRNGNGVLQRKELTQLAAGNAGLPRGQA